MAQLDSRDERIAEVRRALETLQRLSTQLETRPGDDKSRVDPLSPAWIDPPPSTPNNALVAAEQSAEPPVKRGGNMLALFTACLVVLAAAGGAATYYGVIDPTSLLGGDQNVAGPADTGQTVASAPQAAPPETAAAPQAPPAPSTPVAPPSAKTGAAATAATAATTAAANPAAAAPSPAQPAGPVPVTADAGTLERAKTLLNEGDLTGARELLQTMQADKTPDAAWAMARSYDPRFVKGLTNANAQPDVSKAAHWYRVWHKIAQEQGLVSSRMSVDKLIRSMQ